MEPLERGRRVHELIENLYKIEGFFTEYGHGGAKKFDWTLVPNEIKNELTELGFDIKDYVKTIMDSELEHIRKIPEFNIGSIVDGIDEKGAFNITPTGKREYIDES